MSPWPAEPQNQSGSEGKGFIDEVRLEFGSEIKAVGVRVEYGGLGKQTSLTAIEGLC